MDKFLLTYVILKLKLVKGKCILFVNDVERSYRLKLFLEQFSIKSCVLNSELPLNSRWVDILCSVKPILTVSTEVTTSFKNSIRGYTIILLPPMRVLAGETWILMRKRIPKRDQLNMKMKNVGLSYTAF